MGFSALDGGWQMVGTSVLMSGCFLRQGKLAIVAIPLGR
jgi:hypothetical protein